MPRIQPREKDFDPADSERTHPSRNAADRWTPGLVLKGWTTISNLFLENYSRLSPPITHGEAMFIVHLMQHKWDQAAPYPSLVTIGKRMGISTTAARAIARNLEKKKYLHREGQKGRTNRYHLNGLFEALERLDVTQFYEQDESARKNLAGPAPQIEIDFSTLLANDDESDISKEEPF